MDLLVSYSWGGHLRAKQEIARVLERLGDPRPRVEKTRVPGVCAVHTCLDSRDVVARCRELSATEAMFRFAIKWVPVDYWCETSLDAIKRLIDERVVPRIGKQETWAMEVRKRGWEKYHTAEIIQHLTAGIEGQVDLRRPHKLIRVDILGVSTAVSLLRPGEVFSISQTARAAATAAADRASPSAA